jgi:hypothetical protein
MICRTCGRPIERREVSPGMYRWGHVTNPTFQRHYAKPKVAPESEAEKREAYGK